MESSSDVRSFIPALFQLRRPGRVRENVEFPPTDLIKQSEQDQRFGHFQVKRHFSLTFGWFWIKPGLFLVF